MAMGISTKIRIPWPYQTTTPKTPIIANSPHRIAITNSSLAGCLRINILSPHDSWPIRHQSIREISLMQSKLVPWQLCLLTNDLMTITMTMTMMNWMRIDEMFDAGEYGSEESGTEQKARLGTRSGSSSSRRIRSVAQLIYTHSCIPPFFLLLLLPSLLRPTCLLASLPLWPSLLAYCLPPYLPAY
jgi:hypothetical protein